jgi:hypothetical protein
MARIHKLPPDFVEAAVKYGTGNRVLLAHAGAVEVFNNRAVRLNNWLGEAL